MPPGNLDLQNATTKMDTSENPELNLAFEMVAFTNKHLFLTGKAGSGKTTFLHRIQDEGIKRLAVVAPTGVAAINASGMTIHSLFQIPIGLHLPGVQRSDSKQQQYKFSRKKIRLLNNLDLLVIDEISMVRADLLDAVDGVLRRYRENSIPFGGVQLLMIGDLNQLPPVVKPDEWAMLSQYYQTPFYFSSHALMRSDYRSIELRKIYRQSDAEFIELLNQVRDNRLDQPSIRRLNSRYQPNFEPPADQPYITLTTTNRVAQQINEVNLRKLPGAAQSFIARIEGDFPPSFYPNEEVMQFKPGAQVMFIRNDNNHDKRYFNGKIGRIESLNEDSIQVVCPGDSQPIEVVPAEWENIKYSLNESTGKIEEQVLGTFIQMPLKLAWAITIHKSQGLTFERAIIDAQASFASGQVYVALSRCKSLEGIVLRSPLSQNSIKTDSQVQTFNQQLEQQAPDAEWLQHARHELESKQLRDLFSFQKIKSEMQQLLQICQQHTPAVSPEVVALLQAIVDQANVDLFDVAAKFQPQLEYYLKETNVFPSDNPQFHQRWPKASHYFQEKIESIAKGLYSIPFNTDNQTVNTNLSERIRDLQLALLIKARSFEACSQGFTSLNVQQAQIHAELEFQNLQSGAIAAAGNPAVPISARPHQSETRKTSLSMFQAGKTVDEIAAERKLQATTIQTHLADFVAIGEVDIKALCNDEVIAKIADVMRANPDFTNSQIKTELGEGFGYGEIHLVRAHLKSNQSHRNR